MKHDRSRLSPWRPLAAAGLAVCALIGCKPAPDAEPPRAAPASAGEAPSPLARDIAEGTIRGDWDDETAHAIAVDRLAGGKVCPDGLPPQTRAERIECQQHWLVRATFMTLGETRTKVVLYASAARRDAKAKLSVFEFRQDPDGWRLGRTELLFEQWSQCGGTQPDGLKIVNFRDNGYFVLGYEQCFDGKGRRETRLRAMTRVGDRLVEVLREMAGEDNTHEGMDPAAPEAVKWESAYGIDAAAVPDAEVPDIVLEHRGIRRGAAAYEVVRFRFNGERFARMASASQLAAARAAASAAAVGVVAASAPSAPGP